MQAAIQESVDAGCDGVLTKPLDFDLLIKTMAKIAGVDITDTLSIAAQSASTTSHAGIQSMSVENQPIHSTLPMNNPKFSDIVRRFVEGLDPRFDDIEETIKRGDFEELADLGHWLKGASGNCGFAQLSAAGIKLEEAAGNADQATSMQTLDELREMKSRIVLTKPEFMASGV